MACKERLVLQRQNVCGAQRRHPRSVSCRKILIAYQHGESGKLNKEGYVSVAEQLVERFGVRKVAITLRTSLSAFDNLWAGMLYDAEARKACFSTEYKVHIVDRVGGGDSFGGGLIYALISGKGTQEAIDFAAAASCLKHSIEHDFNLVTVQEVEALAAGNGTGRVQR